MTRFQLGDKVLIPNDNRPWTIESEWTYEAEDTYYVYRVSSGNQKVDRFGTQLTLLHSTSIPSIAVTDDELKEMGKAIIWCKSKKDGKIGWARTVLEQDKKCYYFLNPVLMCWEDWEMRSENLNYFYEGTQK